MDINLEKYIGNSDIDDYFHDNTKCLQLMSVLKWENGFVCRKCGNRNFCDGKIPFSRRCTRCKNEESSSSNTLFHNIKFPLHKAFYIAYHVCLLPKAKSAFEIAGELSLRQMTCWNFMHKVENRIARLTQFEPSKKISFPEVLITNDESPFI
jgi:two-component system, sensor histidine kinase LadS